MVRFILSSQSKFSFYSSFLPSLIKGELSKASNECVDPVSLVVGFVPPSTTTFRKLSPSHDEFIGRARLQQSLRHVDMQSIQQVWWRDLTRSVEAWVNRLLSSSVLYDGKHLAEITRENDEFPTERSVLQLGT